MTPTAPRPPRPWLRALRTWTGPVALSLLLAACGGTPAPSQPGAASPPATTPQPAPSPAPSPSPTPVPPPTPAAQPRLTLENLDEFPGPDRLVFSRIHTNAGQFVVHDRVTLLIGNGGTAPLHLTGASPDPGWVLDSPLTFPQTLAPGASLPVTLRFVADQDPALPPRLYTGTLTLASDDPAAPSRTVTLAGLWQGASERFTASNLYDEPSLELIRQALGLGFRLSVPADAAPPTGLDDGSSVPYDQRGAVRPQGDEVLSGYWVAADPSRPVSVQEVGSWSGQGDGSTLGWYPKGDPSPRTVAGRAAGSAQTLFPVASPTSAPGSVQGSFTPGGVFGLVVDGYEYSDPTLNDQTADRDHGCGNLCGQHLRFWPLMDASGTRVPGAYVLAVDYQGINDDYQDEIYLVRNLKPAPVLLKVGATDATHRAPDGGVWLPDRLDNGDVDFDPPGAVDEPATPYTGPVGNTDDPDLYRTYRGNVGNVPQNQRRMTFTLPIDNGTYTVRLHFVDLAHNAPGQRVFDVSVNGQLRLPNFDIVAAAGGGQRAVVEDLSGVAVTGGQVQVTLSASVDYPALSGIEIVR